jgi:DNA-binding protein H-NS
VALQTPQNEQFIKLSWRNLVASYRELLKQREALQKQIDAAREEEVASAIETVRTTVNEYSLTPDHVFGKSKRILKAEIRPAKYRDPASGSTWSGRGREPSWIKGQAREQFLIQD